MHAASRSIPCSFKLRWSIRASCPCRSKMPVGQVRPFLTPLAKLLFARPPLLALRRALLIGLLGRGKAVRPKAPRRDHEVRMVVPLIALAVRRVDRDINRISSPDKFLAREIFNQPFALPGRSTRAATRPQSRGQAARPCASPLAPRGSTTGRGCEPIPAHPSAP